MHHRFFRDSFVGRAIYHLSKHKYFKHQEEEEGYIVPSKYLGERKYLYIDSTLSGEKEVNDKNKGSRYQVVVDWDGPDDPENPYNWPLYQKLFFVLEIFFFYFFCLHGFCYLYSRH